MFSRNDAAFAAIQKALDLMKRQAVSAKRFALRGRSGRFEIYF
jgi:hypothetical protein